MLVSAGNVCVGGSSDIFGGYLVEGYLATCLSVVRNQPDHDVAAVVALQRLLPVSSMLLECNLHSLQLQPKVWLYLVLINKVIRKTQGCLKCQWLRQHRLGCVSAGGAQTKLAGTYVVLLLTINNRTNAIYSCHVQIRLSVLQAAARPEKCVLKLAVLGYGC